MPLSTGSRVCGPRQSLLPGSRAQAQKFWHVGLVAPRHVVASRIRDGTGSPALAAPKPHTLAFPFSREESEAQTYASACARSHNMNINTNTKKNNTAFIRSQAGSTPMASHILTCLYYYEVWNTVILTKDKKI